MAKKRKTIPDAYDVNEIVGTGDIKKLEEIYEKCELSVFIDMLEYSNICKETLEWIMGKGIDLKEVCKKYGILSEQARRGGNIEMFVEHGADPFAEDDILIMAARYHNVKSVETALELGIDMYIKNFSLSGTALYVALHYGDCSDFPKMEQIVRLFLEHGYEISEEERQAFKRQAEEYEFEYDELQDHPWYKESRDEIERSLKNLYELLDITPIPRYIKHDGVSEIQIPKGSVKEQFEIMYNVMVPNRGRAKSMQGEAIRIIGTVNRGLSGGRENINADEKKMLKYLIEFLGQGNPLSDEEIDMVKELRNSKLNDEKIIELASITIKWISMNTSPFPLPEVTYKK